MKKWQILARCNVDYTLHKLYFLGKTKTEAKIAFNNLYSKNFTYAGQFGCVSMYL
jgi:hypothetical protein